MKNLQDTEFNLIYNKMLTKSFIDSFMNQDIETINKILCQNGSFINMRKNNFVKKIKSIFNKNSFKIDNYSKNYSINLIPSEVIHSIDYSLKDENGSLNRYRLNLLVIIKKNRIVEIKNETKFISSKAFEIQKYYN